MKSTANVAAARPIRLCGCGCGKSIAYRAPQARHLNNVHKADAFRSKTIRNPVREQVLVRDGRACAAPGCGRDDTRLFVRRIDLKGPHEEHNLVTLCGKHLSKMNVFDYDGTHSVSYNKRMRQLKWERCFLEDFRNKVGEFVRIKNPGAADRRRYFEENC